ncbi:ankyrin repeat and SAM domain-containing protein 6-like isoform X2 [Centruroides sculpturatus]|nr:ankyrin repeat and SAM domain-containing protein 6-like isoform X2 [Centruroides sculpturatus]
MDNIQRLLIASQHGNLSIVKKLLDEGISVDSQGNEGVTALQYAAANGDNDMLQLLLSHGASVDLPNEYGWTPLMHAAYYGFDSTINILLNHKTKVNTRNKFGLKPIVIAAWNGHLSTVLLLLEMGAIVDTQISEDHISECELTSLMAAVLQGHDMIVQILLKRGVSTNQTVAATGITPLMMGACNGHVQIVNILIEHGAQVNATDICNRNALDIAMMLERTEVEEYLRNKTITKVFTDVKEVVEVLNAVKNDDVTTLQKLLKDDPCLCNCHLDDGATPLMYSAMLGYLHIVQLLIKYGAELDKQDTVNGWTALMQAVFHKKTAVVNCLIEAGANVDITAYNGCQALDLAYLLQEPDNEVIKLLTKKIESSTSNIKLTSPLSGNIPLKASRSSNSRYISKDSQKNMSIMNWLGEVSSNILNRLQTTKFRQLPSPTSENHSPVSCDVFLSPEMAENTQNDRVQLKNLSLSSLPSPGQLLLSPKSFPNVVVPPLLFSPISEITQGRLCMKSGKRIPHSDRTKKMDSLAFHPVHLLKRRNVLNSLNSKLSPSNQADEEKTEKKLNFRDDKSLSLENYQRFSGSFSDTLCSSSTNSRASENSPLDKTLVANKAEYVAIEEKCVKEISISHPEDEIEALLKQLAMEEYIHKFKSQEIDVEAFYSLTDDDLQELGVNNVQKRHQLLKVIQQSNLS